MSIAILDTNVLIELEKRFWGGNKEAGKKLIDLLILKHSEFWIPNTVIREFVYKNRRRERKRYYRLLQILRNYGGSAKKCPIRVNALEIESFMTQSPFGIDEGEADGIMQLKKYISLNNLTMSVVFITNDGDAIKEAKNKDIPVENFDEYITAIREMGYY